MSHYIVYGNPYYGGYYYPYDNQTPYYRYAQPAYVTGQAEGLGSIFHNFEDFQPPRGYPRIYPQYQSPYDINPSRSTPQSSYMQDHARSDDDHRNLLVPENENQLQYQRQGKAVSRLWSKSPLWNSMLERQGEAVYKVLMDYEEIETDEDKILNPEVPTTSPRRSGLRYEGLLKQHPLEILILQVCSSSRPKTGPGLKIFHCQ
ncbi:hypothetical protein PPACK8108_LOCUS5270 [Phakopsora pachyrhizi]|uniref:Uncharacterized protein n=1 Tax=Phakopsora pachyrhizi TaxID=170000 RepID=A0AAV0ANQ2_PHAPC|nr:hypothetical protein PPACK8108_LOCUS5270 [Phakopsora pachyrhizi]